MIKRFLRINSWIFFVVPFEVFWVDLSLHSLSVKLRVFLDHSTIGGRNIKEGQERKGNQRSIKEVLDQALKTRLHVCIELHV